MINFIKKAGLAALVLGLAAQASALTLNGAGSTFVYPIMNKWIYSYAQKTGVQINYASIGSGAGIHQLQERTVDFGASDAFMSPSQMKACGGTIIHIPDTMGAVCIAYNLPDLSKDTHLKFDGKLIADIYMGSVTNWNDPAIAAMNPDATLPDQKITVVHRADGSGTTSIFTDYLTKVSTDWAGSVGHGTAVNWPVGVGGKGNEAVAGVVRNEAGAIGYVELAYVLQTNMAYGLVKNRDGNYIAPSMDAVSKAAEGALKHMPSDFRVSFTDAPGAESYPISGFSWILIRPTIGDPDRGQALVDFLKWAMVDGQKMAPSLDYAPLPDSLVQKILAKLDTVKF